MAVREGESGRLFRVVRVVAIEPIFLFWKPIDEPFGLLKGLWYPSILNELQMRGGKLETSCELLPYPINCRPS